MCRRHLENINVRSLVGIASRMASIQKDTAPEGWPDYPHPPPVTLSAVNTMDDDFCYKRLVPLERAKRSRHGEKDGSEGLTATKIPYKPSGKEQRRRARYLLQATKRDSVRGSSK